MDLIVIINGVISLFMIILVGVYGVKRNIITPKINKGLTKILVEITLPCLIVSSFIFDMDDQLRTNILKCAIYSPIIIIISIIISMVLVSFIKGDRKIIIQFANVFSNCGFIGFPIILSIFGSEGVVYASIFNLFFNIFIWTYGVVLFAGKIQKEDIRKVIFNPAIIAVIIGVVIMILKINVPKFIIESIELVGNMTSPLSMIIIGVVLGNTKIIEYLRDYKIYYCSLIKLIVLPSIFFLIFSLLNELTIVTKTLIIISAMPAAAMTTIFAENYDVEKEFSSVIIFTTTLLFLITFPILLKILL